MVYGEFFKHYLYSASPLVHFERYIIPARHGLGQKLRLLFAGLVVNFVRIFGRNCEFQASTAAENLLFYGHLQFKVPAAGENFEHFVHKIIAGFGLGGWFGPQ